MIVGLRITSSKGDNGMEIVWQLPVIQSHKTDRDWVHPRSNNHAFDKSTFNSLCGRYRQDPDYFETNMPEGTDRKHMCKLCLSKLKEADLLESNSDA